MSYNSPMMSFEYDGREYQYDLDLGEYQGEPTVFQRDYYADGNVWNNTPVAQFTDEAEAVRWIDNQYQAWMETRQAA